MKLKTKHKIETTRLTDLIEKVGKVFVDGVHKYYFKVNRGSSCSRYYLFDINMEPIRFSVMNHGNTYRNSSMRDFKISIDQYTIKKNQIFNEYVNAVDAYLKKHSPHCRYGQACFNVLSEMHSELAESIRASSIDPFYRKDNGDGRIRAFFLFVQENI